ncbi:MAG: hypothetical protein AB7N80_00550 [Bdellovibrionales bacterium]
MAAADVWWVPSESEMLFNSESAPEGFAAIYRNMGPSQAIFFNLHAHCLEGAEDTNLLGVQVGFTKNIRKVHTKLALGVGTVTNIKGHTILGDDVDPRGNSIETVKTGHVYRFGYDPLSVSGTFDWELGRRAVGAWFDLVQNLGLGAGNRAYTVGVTYGSVDKIRGLELGYFFRRVEKDAVLSILADPDFGNGNSDSLGSGLRVRYSLMERAWLSLAVYDNEYNLEGDRIRYHFTAADLTLEF